MANLCPLTLGLCSDCKEHEFMVSDESGKPLTDIYMPSPVSDFVLGDTGGSRSIYFEDTITIPRTA